MVLKIYTFNSNSKKSFIYNKPSGNSNKFHSIFYTFKKLKKLKNNESIIFTWGPFLSWFTFCMFS